MRPAAREAARPPIPFDAIVELASEAVLCHDETGCILFANAAAERMFGYDRVALLGRPLDLLIPEVERVAHRERVRAFAAGPAVARLMSGRPQVRGRHRSGREFPAEVRIARHDAGGQTVMTAIVRDLSERRELERRLQESEARYRLAFEHASDAILVTDPRGRCIDANARAAELLRCPCEDLIGVTTDDLLAPEDLPRFLMARQAAASGGPALAEVRLLRSDGSSAEVELRVQVLPDGRRVSMLREIGEREVRAERSLRLLAETSLRMSAELEPRTMAAALAELAVPELADACRVSLLDGNGLLADDAVRGATPADEALLRELTGSPPSAPDATLLGPVLRSADTLVIDLSKGWPAELQPDPARLAIVDRLEGAHVVGCSLRARGRVLGALILARRRAAGAFAPEELQLVEALAQRAALALDNGLLYREAQRALAAREQVLRVVAHDLRNPLNAVSLGLGRLIATRDPEPAQTRSIAEALKRAVWQADRLISDLLDAARLAAGTLTVRLLPCAPARLVAESVDMYRPLLAERSLALVLDVPEPLPEVAADRQRMLQVLGNLLGNAVKFTPADGRVVVRAAAEGDAVHFSVSDTGPGIPRAQQDLLFVPFWQANPDSEHGAGLGLGIARNLVEAQGGRLWVESEEGRGATFHFTLKVSPPGGSSGAPPAAPRR